MKIFEIGTGYTSIPANMGAATEIVVEELSNSFIAEGYEVTIVDIKDRNRVKSNLPIKEVYMPQFFSSTDTKLGIIHKLKRVLYSLSLTSKLNRLLRNQDGEIILHFHNQYNLFFFLKLTPKSTRNKVKIAYTVHTYAWFGKWDEIKSIIKKRYFQEVYCCQNADKVFVLNDIVGNIMEKHCNVDKNKIIKIINGVNVAKYNETVAENEAITKIKNKYNLQGKKVILQVGSVCDRKNQLGTLNLLIPIMKKRSDIVMAYAGGLLDSTYADSISNRATEVGLSDRVIYLGEVSPGEQLNLLYTISFATIMNSRSEAFALVMAESLSTKRPVFINNNILSSLDFLKEKIGHGIICLDESTFETDLYKILDDTSYYSEIQDKGRLLVETEYSWNVAAKQYINFFRLNLK